MGTEPAASHLLDTPSAAKFLNLSGHTLNKWRGIGRGPAFVKLGERVAYEPATLTAWINANRRRSTSDDGSHGQAA